MKLFLACKIEPTEQYIAVINDLRHLLRQDKILWAEPLNAHLTLKFFGEKSNYRTEKINNQLIKASQKLSPFEFSINKIGAFGSTYQPKIIWFGVENENLLKQIHQTIMDELNPIGYYPDAGNFVPHITLARIAKTCDKKWFWKCIEKYQTSFIQKVKVSELYLFESKLSIENPNYSVIGKYKLTNLH